MREDDRLHLDGDSPLRCDVQAEEDLAWIERRKKKQAREAEIMKDVPGWVVGQSVYHSKRFMPSAMNEFWYPGRFGPED